MVIIVTGTPGTGKTTFAKKLCAQTGYAYLDLKEYAEKEGFILEKDTERNTLVVDHEALMEKLQQELDKNTPLVIDSHFSHELSPSVVEKCYCTKTPLAELKRRLEERGYSEAKVLENIQAEIFDTCHVEALENSHEVEIIWT